MVGVADMRQGEGAEQRWLFLPEPVLKEQLLDACKGAARVRTVTARLCEMEGTEPRCGRCSLTAVMRSEWFRNAFCSDPCFSATLKVYESAYLRGCAKEFEGCEFHVAPARAYSADTDGERAFSWTFAIQSPGFERDVLGAEKECA